MLVEAGEKKEREKLDKLWRRRKVRPGRKPISGKAPNL